MSNFVANILEPFIDASIRHYDQNAFCINDIFYTYKDLTGFITSYRSQIKNNCSYQERIGLVVHDDLETYASIFAIWMEDKAYVPIHPEQPKVRNQEIINQAGCTYLLDSKGNQGNKLEQEFVVAADGLDKPEFSPSEVRDTSLAYILFTSGSTGEPKGVPITKGNLGAFMKAFWAEGFTINHHDRCLQAFDLTFDVSVHSFLVSLTRGACTYTIPHDQIKYSYASGLLEDHEITFAVMAPSMVRFLKPYFDEIRLPALRNNIMTAEASQIDLLAEWARCIPNSAIYNYYGPTEATIYCTYYKFNPDKTNKHQNGMLSIGKPMCGVDALIIDENLRVVEEGERGQLCVAGDQITQGYWENPEKTIAAFIDLPFQGQTKRFYKTGDLCFMDNDSDIMYAGRLDYQIKVQGYRVELGEIEYCAHQYLRDSAVVALPVADQNQNIQIVLFVENESIDIDELSGYLKSKLPAYMIPFKIICLKEFPLNANGKTDRKKLKTSIQ